ncbi:hypothetical protein KY289_016458 [Solanum tuberosum]|nr:hypothetical protein KY289_016458 [Solanum tuberosum]
MKEGESVTSYCARTMEINNKMRFHGDKMNDVTIIKKILRSLTLKYDYVVFFIEESKDIDASSLDELQSSLLVNEQKMNRSSTSEEQDLKAFTFISSNSRGRGRGRGRRRGKGDPGNKDGNMNFRANDDYNKGRGRDFDKSKEGQTLLMVVHAENVPEEQVIWYVDTGCSNHMTSSKSYFTNLNENFRSTILKRKKMVTGLPEIVVPSQVCEECVSGKQHRSQFAKGKSR